METTADDFTQRMLTAINSMMLDMLAAVARKDYEDRRRRQSEGIAKAKREGKYRGRPKNEALRGFVRKGAFSHNLDELIPFSRNYIDQMSSTN